MYQEKNKNKIFIDMLVSKSFKKAVVGVSSLCFESSGDPDTRDVLLEGAGEQALD